MVFGWKVTLLLALSACFGCVRSLQGVSKSKIERANRFVDDLIRKHQDTLSKYATIELPDHSIAFPASTMGISYDVTIKLDKGRIFNLNQITRVGDCVISVDNDVVTLVVNLGVNNVKGSYHYIAKAGMLGANDNLKFTIENPQLILTGKQSFKKLKDLGSKTTNILNFDISFNVEGNIGDIDVDVNISFALDWLLNPIAEHFADDMKSKLQEMVKGPIRRMINNISGESLLELL